MKNSKMMLTPAALAAAADGDFHNAIVAATPGGIEAQEKAGQAMLTLKFNQLPKEYLYWRGEGTWQEALERLGFKIGADADDIFMSITAPAGWTLRPTEHSMHSDICDEQGRKRGSVFYKAAFYDRNANFYLCTRYQAGGDYRGQQRYSTAKDTATGAVLLEKGPFDDYSQSEVADKEMLAYLDERFPKWHDVEAYW